MLKLAYLVELTWLLVDMFSGYLQNHEIFLPGNQTVSALVRLAAAALFVAIILRYAAGKRIWIVLLLLLGLTWTALHTIADAIAGEIYIVADIQFHMKLMMPVLLFGTLQVQLERGTLNASQVRLVVLFNGAVLIFNLLLGLFGIGFGNYGESENGELLGSKGFFYAGNEISATLVAIFALVTFTHRDGFRRHALLLLAVVSVFFVASLVSLSKTSLLGFLLVLLFTMYAYLSRANKIKFSAALAASVLISSPYWLPLLQVSIERWQYFWELRPDFLDFITSGRTERIEQYAAWLIEQDTPWAWLFGGGRAQSELIGSLENDLLDLTMASGLLGLLFYSVWAGWAVSGLSARYRCNRPEGSFTVYMIGIFMVLSVLAGHVMYSATLAPFIALLALTSSRHFPAPAASHSPASRQ